MRTSCGVVLVGVIALSACSTSSGEGGRGRGAAALHVETAPVARMSVVRAADLSGTLISPDQAKVSSEVAGVIRDVPVQLGSPVQVGDALVRIDPRELQLALERADSALRQVEAQLGITRGEGEAAVSDDGVASVRQAQANRDDAKAGYQRASELNSRGIVSQTDKDTSETRLKVAEANYQAAMDNVRSLRASLQDRRAAYDLAVKKLSDAVIKAPVAGAVSERLVQPGEFIRENTQVVTIVQINPLRLRTAIQERYAGLLHQGQPVTFAVEAFPDRRFEGDVAFVGPAVDQSTRTFAVEVLVNNPERLLKPGFFAKGTVSLKTDENVLAAPDDAVSTLAGVSTVYVIENGKARQQIVALGQHQDKHWEIVEGLKGSELLAVSQLNQLSTGASVTTGSADRGKDGAGTGGAKGANKPPASGQ